MAVWEKISGKYIDLITAEADDAQFTLDIRNDPELTKYIPVISNTFENQVNWISRQREKPFDVFFVIKRHDGQSVGTLSFYDYIEKGNLCEIGRYISYGNAFENIEAIFLLLDKLFFVVGLSKTLLNIHEDNNSVISLWSRFGSVYNKKEDMGEWNSVQYFLHKEDYIENRGKIMKLLRYYS